MNTHLLETCGAATFAGMMPFPEVVRLLSEDGIEWYSANLILGVTTHYAADGGHHAFRWPDGGRDGIAPGFDGEAVAAAIRASQRGEILYPEFLRRIAGSGVVYYTVHLHGRKARYFGRHGDFHTEPFPDGK